MKETNMEHYRGEIEAYMQTNTNDERNSCGWQFVKWLMSPYKPEPVLTAREKHFVEFAQTGYIARDESAFLHWFAEKPKAKGSDYWVRAGVCTKLSSYSAGMFPFISWEDEEPWAVEELRKLKVADV